MTVSGMPFDDVRALLQQIGRPDHAAAGEMARAFARAGEAGEGLGRLKGLALWLAETRGRVPPLVGKAGVALYAATHGFSGGAAALPAQRARVDAVAAGAAAVSHLCVANDLSLNVFDLALDLPSGDITEEAALDERGCAATIAFGMEATAEGSDLLCVGALGAQADIAATAVLAALHGTGDEGTIDGIVAGALAFHGAQLGDPLEALRRLGGRDIAALTGAILAARAQKVPVVLDGLPALAAAAVLQKLAPDALAHCLLASAEGPAARRAAARLGLSPLLDLGLSQGEGCAAALAAGIVKSAAVLAGGVAEIARRLG